MTDTVKIAGICTLHLVHPDTKRLLETTFYMAIGWECAVVMQNNSTAWLNPT